MPAVCLAVCLIGEDFPYVFKPAQAGRTGRPAAAPPTPPGVARARPRASSASSPSSRRSGDAPGLDAVLGTDGQGAGGAVYVPHAPEPARAVAGFLPLGRDLVLLLLRAEADRRGSEPAGARPGRADAHGDGPARNVRRRRRRPPVDGRGSGLPGGSPAAGVWCPPHEGWNPLSVGAGGRRER